MPSSNSSAFPLCRLPPPCADSVDALFRSIKSSRRREKPRDLLEIDQEVRPLLLPTTPSGSSSRPVSPSHAHNMQRIPWFGDPEIAPQPSFPPPFPPRTACQYGLNGLCSNHGLVYPSGWLCNGPGVSSGRHQWMLTQAHTRPRTRELLLPPGMRSGIPGCLTIVAWALPLCCTTLHRLLLLVAVGVLPNLHFPLPPPLPRLRPSTAVPRIRTRDDRGDARRRRGPKAPRASRQALRHAAARPRHPQQVRAPRAHPLPSPSPLSPTPHAAPSRLVRPLPSNARSAPTRHHNWKALGGL